MSLFNATPFRPSLFEAVTINVNEAPQSPQATARITFAERAARAAKLKSKLSLMNQMTLKDMRMILDLDPDASKEVVAFELDMTEFELDFVTKRR